MKVSMENTKALLQRGPKVDNRLFAASGLAAGLLASSCCILPLAFVSAGIGGAWVSKLTALAPYQPVFIAAALLALGTGFWTAYRKQTTCAPGSLCERPAATRTTKAVLWLGLVIVAGALSVDFITPFLI
jgi:mercuric ion transport protein